MRYALRHVTDYSYADTVDLSSHIVHLGPRTLAWQSVEAATLTCDPQPTRRVDGVDHFGNAVSWLFLDRPHEKFRLTLDAVVAVSARALPPNAAVPRWEDVAAAGMDGPAAEFVFDSPYVPSLAAAGAYAREAFGPGLPVIAGVREMLAAMRRDFAFRPGLTGISTPVAHVLRDRRGVCQDFSHVMIAGLRALGLPARYVSGYLRTDPPPGQPRRLGADASHAWVGVYCGGDIGWVDCDPTNDCFVSDGHITLAWGRDFSDVSPVRGVILGGGDHTVDVGVDVQPL